MQGRDGILQHQLTFRSMAAVKINFSQYDHQLQQKSKKKKKKEKKIEVVLGQVSRCYDVTYYYVCQKSWIFNTFCQAMAIRNSLINIIISILIESKAKYR